MDLKKFMEMGCKRWKVDKSVSQTLCHITESSVAISNSFKARLPVSVGRIPRENIEHMRDYTTEVL